jgi:hypothetical protein
MRTDIQRTTTNIHVGGVEKLLLSHVFFFFPLPCTDLKLVPPNFLSWSDLTTIKRGIDRKKLFYGADTIFVLMSPSENKSLCVVKSVRMHVIVVARIFNVAAMEKTISPYYLAAHQRREG